MWRLPVCTRGQQRCAASHAGQQLHQTGAATPTQPLMGSHEEQHRMSRAPHLERSTSSSFLSCSLSPGNTRNVHCTCFSRQQTICRSSQPDTPIPTGLGSSSATACAIFKQAPQYPQAAAIMPAAAKVHAKLTSASLPITNCCCSAQSKGSRSFNQGPMCQAAEFSLGHRRLKSYHDATARTRSALATNTHTHT